MRVRHEQEMEEAGQHEEYHEVKEKQELKEAREVQQYAREWMADRNSSEQSLVAWLLSLGLTPQ